MIDVLQYYEAVRIWIARLVLMVFFTVLVLAELCHPIYTKIDFERPDVKDDYSLLRPVDQYAHSNDALEMGN